MSQGNPKGARGEPRNKGILAERKEARRQRSIARQCVRDLISDDEQLLSLDGRPGESKRERSRILARMLAA